MPGTLDFRWDPLELAADNTFSTTIRVEISNWWEAGAPRQVSISVRQRGEDLPPGHQVLVQKGKAIHPLTGLEPRHHYLVVVSGEDRPVEKLISVPELPKPKTPEQEVLESERIQLERARVAHDIKELVQQKPKIPKRVSVTISGERGRQKLLISVSAEDGSLMPGFVGTIQEPSGVTSYTTGDNGTVVHEVNFEEPSRPIEIRAGNHPDLVWRARILGPRKRWF